MLESSEAPGEPPDTPTAGSVSLLDRLLAASVCSDSAASDSRLRRSYCYVRRIVDGYGAHQCSLMACACAYCALLSLVPLLVIGIAALGFFLGRQHALTDVISALQGYAPRNADYVASIRVILTRILVDRRLIGVFGLVGLLYASHQVFLAIQPAFNMVWGVAETRSWFRLRLVALSAAVGSIVLLGCNLAAIGLFAYIAKYSLPFLPSQVESWFIRVILTLAPMFILVMLFLLLYRFLPNHVVPWRDAFIGATVAAVLWQITLVGFGAYLAHAHSYSRLYGPLGGLVILVVWAYYSMVILLIGAEICADSEITSHGLEAAESRVRSHITLDAATGRDQDHRTKIASANEDNSKVE